MFKGGDGDTIAAIATALGSSGIGIVRVSGNEALSVVNQIFYSKKPGFDLKSVESHTIHYGMIRDGEELIDEALLLVMR